MMHQPVDKNRRGKIKLSGRPKHRSVIQKDEIINLLIDLETLEEKEIYTKYFEK
jgi:hypothetical protein